MLAVWGDPWLTSKTVLTLLTPSNAAYSPDIAGDAINATTNIKTTAINKV
jgi:hypothetical protein